MAEIPFISNLACLGQLVLKEIRQLMLMKAQTSPKHARPES